MQRLDSDLYLNIPMLNSVGVPANQQLGPIKYSHEASRYVQGHIGTIPRAIEISSASPHIFYARNFHTKATLTVTLMCNKLGRMSMQIPPSGLTMFAGMDLNAGMNLNSDEGFSAISLSSNMTLTPFEIFIGKVIVPVRQPQP